jgi:hypothetical protein
VNLVDPTQDAEVKILLNLDTDSMIRADRLLEEAISVASSLARVHLKDKERVSVWRNGLTEEEQRNLKKIDDDFLWYDLEILLEEPQSLPEPAVHVKPDYRVRPFEEVEREYLELFRKLSDPGI